MNIYAVVMAGGSGTRFWPASRKNRPKQLLSLTGNRSMLQQTVERISPLIPAENVLIVTGGAYAAEVADQLPQLGESQVLAEPVGRNTAAAAGVGAAWVARRDPRGVCLVLPADHLITDEALFLRTLEKAAQVAFDQSMLVTLGLTPRYPATGFGYIEGGAAVDEANPKVYEVQAFHEKPELARAQQYLESGRHMWNSGMFGWRADTFMAEMQQLMPELADGLAILSPDLDTPSQSAALERIYPGLPANSVDYGILEKTQRLRVVRADFGWSDVGSWEAMAELWPADESGNACNDGDVLAIDAKGNIVSAQGRLTALLGVDNLVAVVTDDVLMVLPKDRCQDVRLVIDQLKEKKLDDFL